jgi:hypothetical protein
MDCTGVACVKEDIMAGTATVDRVRGKTFRWTFTEGPQAGKAYEHTFHEDGTVAYRAVENGSKQHSPAAPDGNAGSPPERPHYAAVTVSDDVEMVSYLADSGFTLTVALNFADHRLASIASNNEQWFPAQGTFAEVGA